MSETPLYRLERVRRIVDGGETILDIDELDLPQGGLTAIVGPNGAGKSTLLKILAFLERPEQGTIHYRGGPVESRDLVRLRRHVTLVDQAPLLFRGTVLKNVTYGLRVRGVPSREWPTLVADALSLVDLSGFEDRSVHGLSGGETQRIAIARALVFKPQVVLLDEPTAGIDAARKEMVERLITELHTIMGVTVLFSTHSLAQAHFLTERVIHLAGGRIVPHSIDNLFSGQAEAGLVRLRCGTTVRTRSKRTGPMRFSVPAASVEVVLFSDRDDRADGFDGTITRMELRGGQVRLVLSGKLSLRAEMSPEEFQRKDLQLGSRVTAIIPPDAIRLLQGEA
ncbi:MAG: ABC transporter ATP-binding protein [bacterium]|nr:ABC transporter ATP-binding protein [bacterium]